MLSGVYSTETFPNRPKRFCSKTTSEMWFGKSTPLSFRPTSSPKALGSCFSNASHIAVTVSGEASVLSDSVVKNDNVNTNGAMNTNTIGRMILADETR